MQHYDIDAHYGNVAVQLGLVDPNEARLCAQLKQQSGGQYSLEQILLQRGTLSPQHAQLIRQHLQQYPQAYVGPAQSSYAGPMASSVYPQASSHYAAGPATSMGMGAPTPMPAGPGSSGYVTPVSGTWAAGAAAGPAEVKLPEIGETFGRYRIEGILGKGGMGIVFKAVHLDLHRTVALKMLVSGVATSEKQLKRFQTEARSAARLSHPCIVPIHDISERDGLHYFTMDFVEGTDLATELKQRRFTEEEGLSLIRDLADALGYAHANDVIHRDLKPANILINEEGRPHITDFGIAKDFKEGDGQTISGEVLGTPAYMSPEQADGSPQKIDGRADLFSLGTILYEMLYHEQAFQGATQYAIVTQVLTHDPEPPALERDRVSPAAEAICFKLLEKQRARRYRTGQELVEDIERALAGKAPLAPARRSTYRPFRELPALGALAASALLPLIVWGIWSSSLGAELAALEADGSEKGMAAKKEFEALQATIRSEQKAAQGLIEAAEATAAGGRIEEALVDAEKALELDPVSPELRLRVAELMLGRLRAPARVPEVVAPLLSAGPPFGLRARRLLVEACWAQRDSLQTRKALAELVEAFPDEEHTPFAHRIEGLLAERDGNWKVAIDELRAALAAEPQAPEVRARLAHALARTRAWDAALDAAEQALGEDGELGLAWVVKAMALETMEGRERDALGAIQQARRFPEGETEDARRLYETLQKTVSKLEPPPRPPVKPAGDSPEHTRAHQLIAAALKAAQAKDEKTALKHLDAASPHLEDCVSAYNTFGVVLETLERNEDALKTFKSAVKLAQTQNQPNHHPYANAAYVLTKLGDGLEALKYQRYAEEFVLRLPPDKRNGSDDYVHRTREKAVLLALESSEAALEAGDMERANAGLNAIVQLFRFLASARQLNASTHPLEAPTLILQARLLLTGEPDATRKKHALLNLDRASEMKGYTMPAEVATLVAELRAQAGAPDGDGGE